MRTPLRISLQNVVSIFHDRNAAQPAIVANVTVLGDYDDHRPDLIQSRRIKKQFGASAMVCGRAGPGENCKKVKRARKANGQG